MLDRFLADLLCDEFRALRPGCSPPPAQPWPHQFLLDEGGLGLDSLERMVVGAEVTQALHLHESGIEDLLLARRRFGEWVEIAGAGLRQFNQVMTFRTSGSNGTPKACSHPLSMLIQETQWLAALLADTRRIVFTVSGHHIYGFLFTILLPHQIDCVELIDARLLTPQSVQQLLRAGDLLVSYPAHLSIFAKLATQIRPGVVGVTSTAPCPEEIPAALSLIGLDRLVEVYGSTETCGVGWRESPGNTYRLMPFWSRDLADDTSLIRTMPDGSMRTYPLQDRLAWGTDGCFSVQGRRDEAVQIGGVNVFPAQVRRKLLEHPQVADVAVRVMTSEQIARLKVFIVPALGVAAHSLRRELVRWSELHLPAPQRPKAFAFGSELPVNEQGNLCDWDAAGNSESGDGSAERNSF